MMKIKVITMDTLSYHHFKTEAECYAFIHELTGLPLADIKEEFEATQSFDDVNVSFKRIK